MNTLMTNFLILCIFLALFLSLIPLQLIPAQALSIEWSEPVNISNTENSSAQPTVAGDEFGYVHVVWSEDVDGKPLNGSASRAGKALIYTRGDGNNWSPPIDIIWTNNRASFPSLVVDSSGVLHLIWSEQGALYYSKSPNSSATSSKSWTEKTSITQTDLIDTPPQLLIDKNDTLHLVYADWGNTGYPYQSTVYYTFLEDQGEFWSSPIPISPVFSDEEVSFQPQATIDPEGKLHVVWTQKSYVEGGGPVGVYYTHSDPVRKNFIPPKEITGKSDAEGWMSAANIISSNQTILITWVCGELAHRCSVFSLNGGESWSGIQRLFGDLNGLGNRDALVLDGENNIFWIALLRNPKAIYFSEWVDGRWVDPPIPFLLKPPTNTGHYPSISNSMGNRLSLVLVDQDVGEIYYVEGKTKAVAKHHSKFLLKSLPQKI